MYMVYKEKNILEQIHINGWIQDLVTFFEGVGFNDIHELCSYIKVGLGMCPILFYMIIQCVMRFSYVQEIRGLVDSHDQGNFFLCFIYSALEYKHTQESHGSLPTTIP